MTYRAIVAAAGVAATAMSGAPVAHATVATSPHLTVSNEVSAKRTSVTHGPLALEERRFLFIDTGHDGIAEFAVVVQRSAGGDVTAIARRVPASSGDCQQYGGAGSSRIDAWVSRHSSGAITVSLPSSALGAALAVKEVLDSAPACVRAGDFAGKAVTMDGALRFVDVDAPAAPIGLTAAATHGFVRLDWADNRELDLNHYVVYRKAGDGEFTRVGVTHASAFVDESVHQGVTYTYYVVAVDFRPHRTASAHVSVTPEAPAAPPADALVAQEPAQQPAEELLPVDAEPATHHSPRSAAPRRLKVARVTRHSVTLSWPAVHGARYLVFRRMPKRPWSREPVGATERGRFTDRRLKAHTRYEYRLVAVSSAGARSEAWPAVRVRTRSRKR